MLVMIVDGERGTADAVVDRAAAVARPGRRTGRDERELRPPVVVVIVPLCRRSIVPAIWDISIVKVLPLPVTTTVSRRAPTPAAGRVAELVD